MSEFLAVVFPGMMILWLFFIAQTPMSEVLTEQRDGTLARLMSTPVSLSTFLIAKMIRAYLISFTAQAIMILAGIVIFQVDWGNPLLLLGIGAFATLSVIGPVAIIYSFCENEQQASTISPIVIITICMLGGSMFPYEAMPTFMQQFAVFTPTRWAILGYQRVIYGEPFTELIQPILILTTIGIVTIGIALVQFERRLRTRGIR